MLSRSNSNADRIRRAKSTSSTHTASSGPRPSHPPSDPFVTRQQAETAALEAYYRAQQQAPHALSEHRAVPPKLERRRSRVSGHAEGGHFEEARLNRRKSASKRDENAAARPSRSRSVHLSDANNESNNEEKVITRKRSVIPPNSSAPFNYSLPSSSSRHARKSQFGHTDGSPIPRHTSALKERRSILQISTQPVARKDSGRDGSSRQSYDFGQETVPTIVTDTSNGAIPDTQTRQQEVALARDRCLQDFQQKKLRERKSFILGPFQKKKSSTVPKSLSSVYDTSLPPFNCAEDTLLASSSPPPTPPPPPPPEAPAPNLTIQHGKKARNFSESLKGKFKKVFRRSSRMPSELPAQHVKGKHFYFPSSSPLSTPGISNEKQEDPFTTYDGTYLQVPDRASDNTSGRYSATGNSTARSRVTSWTNSTAAGTWSTRPDDASADEHGRLTRSDSVSTLRKATSFLGRPIKNKLRKQSKAELKSSEESAGLYSALQVHINSPKATNPTASNEQGAEPRLSSALATLPSQQRAEGSSSSQTQWPAPTIRSVTPDAVASRSDPLSPVTEVLSPNLAPTHSGERSKTDDEESNPTPRGNLQRRPAIKAPTPSKEQIACRIERSKNRWQSPLDELSPTAPRVASKAAMEDNPYELRSLSRTIHHSIANNDLPHHAKVHEPSPIAREDVLSPSVYSRGTDGATPAPETPSEQDQGGTMVTITGHEVRTYSISPKKPQPPVTGPARLSQEWRRWLSDEMNGWSGISAPQGLDFPSTDLVSTKSSAVGVVPPSRDADVEKSNDTTASSSPALDATPLEPNLNRRKAKRGPSFMNDRYPMLDTGRQVSDKTIKHTSRISSCADSVPGSIMLGSEKLGSPSDETPTGASRPSSVVTTGRVVSKHQSLATLRSTGRTSTTLAMAAREVSGDKVQDRCANNDLPNSNGDANQEADPATKVSNKPKSAFDLRANYKTNVNARTKPLAVHRKSDTNQNILIFEDNTIQNISAGPYASQAAMPTAPDANKENTPPFEANGLPALSSSEWLAAGTNKKRDARKASAVHPAHRNRSSSKYSQSRAVTPGSPPAIGDNSPGQRLVTNWLDGKKSKESSPAFV